MLSIFYLYIIYILSIYYVYFIYILSNAKGISKALPGHTVG